MKALRCACVSVCRQCKAFSDSYS